jgi:hypothetical protein
MAHSNHTGTGSMRKPWPLMLMKEQQDDAMKKGVEKSTNNILAYFR